MLRYHAPNWKSPKSLLHEFCQKHGAVAQFSTEGVGQPHNRVFTSRVTIPAVAAGSWGFEETTFVGHGKSKKDAEHSAAGEALLFLEEKELVYGYSAKNAVTPGSDPLPSRKRPRTASGLDPSTMLPLITDSDPPGLATAGPVEAQIGFTASMNFTGNAASPLSAEHMRAMMPLEAVQHTNFLPVPTMPAGELSESTQEMPLFKELHRLTLEVLKMGEIMGGKNYLGDSVLKAGDWSQLLEACRALLSGHGELYGQQNSFAVSPNGLNGLGNGSGSQAGGKIGTGEGGVEPAASKVEDRQPQMAAENTAPEVPCDEAKDKPINETEEMKDRGQHT